MSYVAGDDGHQVGAAAYREGGEGAVVMLADGETAYAGVGFAQVGNYDPSECRPATVRGFAAVSAAGDGVDVRALRTYRLR